MTILFVFFVVAAMFYMAVRPFQTLSLAEVKTKLEAEGISVSVGKSFTYINDQEKKVGRCGVLPVTSPVVLKETVELLGDGRKKCTMYAAGAYMVKADRKEVVLHPDGVKIWGNRLFVEEVKDFFE